MSNSEILNRIERLEKSARIWKGTAFCAMVACVILLGVTVFTFLGQGSKAEEAKRPDRAPVRAVQENPQMESALSSSVYFNTARANYTAEEVVLDCGLNPSMDGKEPVKLTHRIIMNFHTAKRTMLLLQGIVDHHEKTFGELELDIQKRVKKN
jgi:Protein of unknown function (DUF3467)